MIDFLKNLVLTLLSIVIAFVLLEFGSRLIYPVQYGHKSFTMDGDPLTPAKDELTLKPDLEYRQKTQEFDKITTHTSRGFRGPKGSHMDPQVPDVIFIGDSMTYGIGLTDEETFPYIYCEDLKLACVNLGRPGSSTVDQILILQHYMETYKWRPKKINLIMNVMSSALFGGNDLADNITDARNLGKPAKEKIVDDGSAKKTTLKNKIVAARKDILAQSNLARVGYYIFAPALRSKFSPAFDMQKLQEATTVTQEQLKLLDNMSQKYGFDYTIYLVHPMQDLINNTWQETLGIIKGAAASQNVVSTAPALLDSENAVQYYYPLDGHVRPEGARKIAEYMEGSLKELR